MPLKYKIIEDNKLVYVLGTGSLDYHDLMDHIESLSQDPKYKPPMLKLVDYRNITGYGLTTEESRLFSERKAHLSKHFASERCAFVVPSDVGYGMARQHQAFIDETDLQTEIFRDFQEAKDWLGIDINDEELAID